MNKKIIISILLIIFLIQSVQLSIWIKKDNSPPAWDQSWHAMISINKYNQLLKKNSLTTDQVGRIYPIFSFANNLYPPFFHISSIPFYILFGTDYDSALMTNLLFLAILILSAFFIGKKIYDNESGLLASFIASTIPIYNSMMRDYLIDFSLCAMVALGFALLLYAEHFENFKYSILFGIVLGLGMLTKWTYVVYLIVPIFYSLFIFLKKNWKSGKLKSKLKNILFWFLSAFAISISWYNPSQLKRSIPLLLRFTLVQGSLEGDPVFYSLKGLFHYLFVMINQYSLFYFLIFLFGIVTFVQFYKKNKIPIKNYLYSIIFIYFIFTLISNKDPRYIIPIYIFLVITSIFGIFIIDNKKIRYSAIALIVVFGLFQNISYNSQTIDVNYNINGISIFNSKGIYPHYSKIDIDEILSAINNLNNKEYFSVCIAAESNTLNDVNIPYYAFKENYPVRYMVGNGCNPLEFDYTILGPIHQTWRSGTFENSKSILNNNIDNFEVIYSSGEINIYKRI